MIYRVFCSNCDTEEKIKRVRNKECALDVKFTSSVKEIEADNFIEAATIYSKKYEYELDELVDDIYHFFFIDSEGNILDRE